MSSVFSRHKTNDFATIIMVLVTFVDRQCIDIVAF